jgi:hypothetical protein
MERAPYASDANAVIWPPRKVNSFAHIPPQKPIKNIFNYPSLKRALGSEILKRTGMPTDAIEAFIKETDPTIH